MQNFCHRQIKKKANSKKKKLKPGQSIQAIKKWLRMKIQSYHSFLVQKTTSDQLFGAVIATGLISDGKLLQNCNMAFSFSGKEGEVSLNTFEETACGRRRSTTVTGEKKRRVSSSPLIFPPAATMVSYVECWAADRARASAFCLLSKGKWTRCRETWYSKNFTILSCRFEKVKYEKE